MIVDCSVLETTNFIGKKWTLLIFLELYKKGESLRYNELLKSLKGISPRVLSQRLKEMVSNGLVENVICDRESSYYLTPCGLDLINITKSYKEWALKWKIKNKLCSEMDCKKCEF